MVDYIRITSKKIAPVDKETIASFPHKNPPPLRGDFYREIVIDEVSNEQYKY